MMCVVPRSSPLSGALRLLHGHGRRPFHLTGRMAAVALLRPCRDAPRRGGGPDHVPDLLDQPNLVHQPEVVSSVHTPQTNDEPPIDARQAWDRTPSVAECSFRHSGWKNRRAVVHQAFAELLKDPKVVRMMRAVSSTRYERFLACGSCSWLLRSQDDPSRYAIASNQCGDRFCEPCSAARARSIRRSLHDKIKGGVHRFVTLTLKTAGYTLRDDVDRLYASFRRMKQRQFWKRHVKGGIAFCEVKWKPDRARWHPHFHILCHGKYLPQRHLSDEWRAATGDSFVVDIRVVRNAKKASEYVSKYVTKGYDASVFDDVERLKEAIVALKGRRLLMKLGDWVGLDLDDGDSDEAWTTVCRLETLLDRVRAGDATACAIMGALRHAVDETLATDADETPRAPPVERLHGVNQDNGTCGRLFPDRTHFGVSAF